MAWKVTDFMHSPDPTRHHKVPMGPLPVKLWVRVAGEKIRRTKNTVPKADRPVFGDTEQTLKAIEYARWLAQRDGMALPEWGATRVQWDFVPVPGKSKPEERARGVWFTIGEQGASGWRMDLVEIPNWDWTPCQAVEMFDHEFALAA